MMPRATLALPALTAPEATIAAALGGTALTALLGWLTGLWRWLFGWRRRRDDAEDRALRTSSRTIESLARQVDLLNERLNTSDRTVVEQNEKIHMLETQTEDLRRARIADIDANKQALDALAREKDARREADLTAARLEHEGILRAVTQRYTAQIEEADERATVAERRVQELTAALHQLEGELATALARQNPGIRPSGPIC